MKRLLLSLFLCLPACATDAPVTRAVQPLPAYYSVQGGEVAATEWWKRRLQDPALAALVEAALANSPDLAGALARVERARAGLRAAGAERMPALDGNASVTYNRTAAGEIGFDPGNGQAGPQIDRERILYRAGIEGSWDADLFGRLRADERAARARLDAAGLEAAAVRLTLITDVARNYVAARAADARRVVVLDNVESARDTLSVTRSRVKGGLVAGIDEVRAQSLLAETASTLAPVDAERGARLAALATLTGLPPTEIGSLVAAAAVQPELETPDTGLPSELLLRRPDIAAALARIAAADQDVAAAIAARYPRLTISSTIGLVATALGDLFSGDALGIVAGPGLAGSILDFGRNKARVDDARARTAEAVADYRTIVLRAFGEVEANLAATEALQRRVVALERLVAANEEAASIARIQYRRGLTDFLGALDAERALLRSREQLIATQAEAADAQIALFRSIGGDFQASRLSS